MLSSKVRDRLERVYRAESRRLWKALLAFSGDREVASDAVAEAFTQAMERGDDIRSLEAWVWRAAFRIAGGELKRRRARPIADPPGQSHMPAPLNDLLAALRRLPDRQRAAVLLHDYGDRPADEVADTLGISRATVYVHLSQGRRRLRKLLEAQDAE